jgi:hypothetical protein
VSSGVISEALSSITGFYTWKYNSLLVKKYQYIRILFELSTKLISEIKDSDSYTYYYQVVFPVSIHVLHTRVDVLLLILDSGITKYFTGHKSDFTTFVT